MNLASWIVLGILILIAALAFFIIHKNKGRCSCCNKECNCCKRNKK